MLDSVRGELEAVAEFYDQRLVGTVGPLGFRRTTELRRLLSCLPALVRAGLLDVGRSRFLDLGCGDGRVNILMSYVTEFSVGVEIDEWILDEYAHLRPLLDKALRARGLREPPRNVALVHGDATQWSTFETLVRKHGIAFGEFDLFYTFLTAHEAFASLIALHGKPGCTFLVYGMNRVFACYEGLELIRSLTPLSDALAVYRKPLA